MENYVYHFTSRYHLPMIFKSGYLKLTESNLKAPTSREDALPKPDHELIKPVVWLTRDAIPMGLSLEGSIIDKTEIRITLRKRDHYEPWILWSRKNRINKTWAKCLERGNNPNGWYISEKIIPLNSSEVVKIENVKTGEIIIDINNEVKTGKVEISRPHGMSIFQFGQILSYFKCKRGGVYELAIE